MTQDRFGNVPTADLLAREREARAELECLRHAVRARLIADSGITPGKVYRVASAGARWEQRLDGRLMLVEGVNAGMRGIPGKEEFYCFAWGRMNGRSAAGDGWTIKRQNVAVDRLVPVEDGNP